MSKIVVFGGSGFIGSHVSDKLAELGHEVLIYDLKESNYLGKNKNLVIGDLLDFDLVLESTKNAEAVYNFSALADLNLALDEPFKTININILGNSHILEACRQNKVKRFIFASSVYVNSIEGGFYGCSKKSAEIFVEEYQKRFGLDYTILRFGSLYGPRSNLSNGLKKIITKALKNKILSYEGDKESIREYIHVRDAAIAAVDALDNKFKNKKIIITGHQSVKVIELLNMLAEIMQIPQSKIQVNKSDYEGHYVRSPYNYESNLAIKYLPETYIDLGEGLLETIKEIDIKNN